jgi:hypothetical protein
MTSRLLFQLFDQMKCVKTFNYGFHITYLSFSDYVRVHLVDLMWTLELSRILIFDKWVESIELAYIQDYALGDTADLQNCVGHLGRQGFWQLLLESRNLWTSLSENVSVSWPE